LDLRFVNTCAERYDKRTILTLSNPHTVYIGGGTCVKTTASEEVGLVSTKLNSISISRWHVGDLICGLVVGIPGYRFTGPGSIPGGTRFSER
jgi:hypothetical protein